MPDVNLESVTSLLYAIALLGSVVALYTMAIMVAPGLLLSSARDMTVNVTRWHLLAIAAGATAIWAIVLCCMFGLLPTLWAWALGSVTTVLCPVLGVTMDRRQLTGNTPLTPESATPAHPIDPLQSKTRAFVWSFVTLILVALVMAISLLFIGIIGLDGDLKAASEQDAVLTLVGLLALIALTAAILAGAQSDKLLGLSLILAPMLLFAMLALVGNFSAFSVMTVRALGQGEINAARITVTGKTCREINQTLGQRVCAETTDDEATAICPVSIRSRIGSQVLLEFAPMRVPSNDATKATAAWSLTMLSQDQQKPSSLVRRVILDKAKLLSWQPLRDFTEEATPYTRGTVRAPVASWLGNTPNSVTDADNHPNPTLFQVLRDSCGAVPEELKRPGDDKPAKS